MGDLGAFGAAVRELDPNREQDSFTFCGKPFKVVADMPPMLAFQMGAAATGKVDQAEGLAAVWISLRISLDEPDLTPWDGAGEDTRPAPLKQFDDLYKLAVETHASAEELTRLALKLFEGQTGRPTERQSDSSDSPSTTSRSSSALSSDPRLPSHLRPVSEVLSGLTA